MDHPDQNTIQQEMESIYRLYASLAHGLDTDMGLGGQLLFVGEPSEPAACLLRAANIAGAASLAASADAPALRRVMREGALDFVVTSLDEALRILKNEIRKKQPVAVGVSVAAGMIAREMLSRGVQPDLLPAEPSHAPELATFLARGARAIELQPLPTGSNFLTFPIPPSWKQPTAGFDALLLDCLAPGDQLDRRWVRLAPRYLPASARRFRSVLCGDDPTLQRILGLDTMGCPGPGAE